MKHKSAVSGLSLSQGQNENSFFCEIEYFKEKKRWFLTHLKQAKDEVQVGSDNIILSWLNSVIPGNLIVDHPLTPSLFEDSKDNCLDTNEAILRIQKRIDELLRLDEELYQTNPKKYEQERNKEDLIDRTKSTFEKKSVLISKSFKRRLKKGILPYWNREVDFWVWENYYDSYLEFFSKTYDSFGNVSLFLLKRFEFLRQHLSHELIINESDPNLILLELYRSDIISKKHLLDLKDSALSIIARMEIIKEIEKKLSVFIYDFDLEVLSRQPKAFCAFLLAIAAKYYSNGDVKTSASFNLKKQNKFIVPIF